MPHTSPLSHDTHCESNLALRLQSGWQQIMQALEQKAGQATYHSWLSRLSFGHAEGADIILHAPSRLVKEWISSHHHADLRAIISQHLNQQVSITLQVKKPAAQTNPSLSAASATPSSDEAHTHETVIPFRQPSGESRYFGAQLDRRFSFERFVTSDSNRLASTACRQVAANGSVGLSANPLFLSASVGRGKTHLLQATAHALREAQPHLNVVYLSAEYFTHHFIRALKDGSINQFKSQLRSADMLMVDDLQFLAGKPNVQEELLHTMVTLLDSGKQMMISSSQPLSELTMLDERIRSRIASGLCLPIAMPETALLNDILMQKTRQMQVVIPEETLPAITEAACGSVRALEGMINQISAQSMLNQQPVTTELIQDILSGCERLSAPPVTITRLLEVTAEASHVLVQDLLSARRSRNIARPRQLAMYLAKKYTNLSLPDIGRAFGGKDHTTVIHAARRAETLIKEDANFQALLKTVERRLHRA